MRENFTVLYVKNKDTDQNLHLSSLISTFVVRFLKSIINEHASCKKFKLVAVAEKAELCLNW